MGGGCVSGQISTMNTAQRLEQWGLWARNNPDKLGYSSIMLKIIQDNIERKHRRYIYVITDDEAMDINDAMAALKRCQPKVSDAIHFYCVGRMTFEDMGDRLNCSRKMAANLYDQGLMWVEGYFSLKEMVA